MSPKSRRGKEEKGDKKRERPGAQGALRGPSIAYRGPCRAPIGPPYGPYRGPWGAQRGEGWPFHPSPIGFPREPGGVLKGPLEGPP